MTIDLQELKKAADSALRWRWFSKKEAFEATGDKSEAEFILKFSPAVALELIARLERAEKIVAAAENSVKVKGRHHSELAYERLERATAASKSNQEQSANKNEK